MARAVSIGLSFTIAMLAGCATSPPSEPIAVPQARQYAAPPSGPAVLTVTRDEGLFGALCGVQLYFDGEHIAKLAPSEQISYRIPTGDHIVSADMSAGACNAGMQEVQIDAAADKATRLRISTGGAGDLSISPTAF